MMRLCRPIRFDFGEEIRTGMLLNGTQIIVKNSNVTEKHSK